MILGTSVSNHRMKT